MRSLEEVFNQTIELNLKRADYFPTNWQQLVGIYNGCGPDAMPSFFRDGLTRIFEEFEPAFMVHDDDYAHSDGTAETYKLVAQRITENCFIIANAIGKDPDHFSRLRTKANLILEALEIWGFDSYKTAFEKAQGNG